MNFKFILFIKGFCMGIADIIPGVSGGTIALITGVYDELIKSLSSVNSAFIQDLFKLKINSLWNRINGKFLLPLGIGILFAIVSMSKLVHFVMKDFPIQTWALFFGLICASVIYLSRKIDSLKDLKNIIAICSGAVIGYSIVSLVPIHTANTLPNIFFAGMIAIIAMILPGISGSFILLILGKYMYITGAIKALFVEGNWLIIAVFGSGCVIGLLSFSKVLNVLLEKYYSLVMAVLTGFMIGSLKKIWPWREVLETKIVRGKTYVLSEVNIIPESFDMEFISAIIIMLIGFSLVFLIEKVGLKK